ncbi:MAG: DUF2163 domain-containing protein [Alphaproteobacteria bacterium]|nr:DUF2163 domain-containing protein [Alphaproteobacteria bacterium]
MRVIPEKLAAHLAGGATSLCRCWRLSRRDGVVMGFTDHDRDINFDGVSFRAGTGLDAAAIYQTTGLSVDNSQAVGALSDFGLDDVDIRAGRYDRAEVLAWLVNWRDVSQRLLQFRGSIGEIRRNGGVFEAELRGLSEALNQPEGRAYHKNCSAVLGDSACKFDVLQPGYFTDAAVLQVAGRGKLVFAGLVDFAEGWFEKGLVRVLGGVGAGLSSVIQADRFLGGERLVDLWQELPVDLAVGDMVRLEAGCDKRVETCRLKFHNFRNYRGFPQIPGADWAMSYPTKSGVNNGGKLL